MRVKVTDVQRESVDPGSAGGQAEIIFEKIGL
jgi:hypothetical protein